MCFVQTQFLDFDLLVWNRERENEREWASKGMCRGQKTTFWVSSFSSTKVIGLVQQGCYLMMSCLTDPGSLLKEEYLFSEV